MSSSRHHTPPGFRMHIYRRTPRRHREDLLQEAWLGFLDGRNPNTVSRNYLARELLHELREDAASQVFEVSRDPPRM